MTVINFTDKDLTPEQIKGGAIELNEPSKSLVRRLLRFECIPGLDLIHYRAEMIADIAAQTMRSESMGSSRNYALIGGECFLISVLEKELTKRNVSFCYSYDDKGIDSSMNPGHIGFIYM